MKQLIGKTIENVFEDLHSSDDDLVITCEDGTKFNLTSHCISYDGDVEIHLKEMTDEKFKEWKAFAKWKEWKNKIVKGENE